jgi:hypothetical protein
MEELRALRLEYPIAPDYAQTTGRLTAAAHALNLADSGTIFRHFFPKSQRVPFVRSGRQPAFFHSSRPSALKAANPIQYTPSVIAHQDYRLWDPNRWQTLPPRN